MRMWPGNGRRKALAAATVCAAATLGLAACGSCKRFERGQADASQRQADHRVRHPGPGRRGHRDQGSGRGVREAAPQHHRPDPVPVAHLRRGAAAAPALLHRRLGHPGRDHHRRDLARHLRPLGLAGQPQLLPPQTPARSSPARSPPARTTAAPTRCRGSSTPRACTTAPTWSRPRRPRSPSWSATPSRRCRRTSSLKEGLAFEGDEYEGAVTAFQSFGAQIGLKNLSNIDNPANTAALELRVQRHPHLQDRPVGGDRLGGVQRPVRVAVRADPVRAELAVHLPALAVQDRQQGGLPGGHEQDRLGARSRALPRSPRWAATTWPSTPRARTRRQPGSSSSTWTAPAPRTPGRSTPATRRR